MFGRWLEPCSLRKLVPIEVKWTENTSLSDVRHLLAFLAEHQKQARHDYLICRCRHPLVLHKRITALPWYAR